MKKDDEWRWKGRKLRSRRDQIKKKKEEARDYYVTQGTETSVSILTRFWISVKRTQFESEYRSCLVSCVTLDSYECYNAILFDFEFKNGAYISCKSSSRLKSTKPKHCLQLNRIQNLAVKCRWFKILIMSCFCAVFGIKSLKNISTLEPYP